jgi:hypothetical protein
MVPKDAVREEGRLKRREGLAPGLWIRPYMKECTVPAVIRRVPSLSTQSRGQDKDKEEGGGKERPKEAWIMPCETWPVGRDNVALVAPQDATVGSKTVLKLIVSDDDLGECDCKALSKE